MCVRRSCVATAAVRSAENTVPLLLYHFIFVYVAAATCLESRCLETALEYLLISRWLHSDGSTRYNIIQ
jgi:hypothetical protein